MKKRIVIALGGNALGNSPSEQLELVKVTAKNIVDLVAAGNNVIVTHGNGPQVGMINLAMEVAHNEIGSPDMPFAESGAMSQGYIGYHLQQSIQRELLKRGMRRNCLTVITQVLVDKEDPAFKNPTKPIGSFYDEKQAKQLSEEKGYIMKEDAGRGYRRVVPSPLPVKVIEINTIKDLLNKGNVVIACGGGGIPVYKYRNSVKGVDAVIDKDRTSARLALDLKADMLIILTAVSEVSINFGKPNEEKLTDLSVHDAKRYINAHEFAEGSMLPKVEACIEFASKRKNGVSIITSLQKAALALDGKAGTRIHR